jgi:Rps23 Pro-64 3,4-dihydroxylase Tpa1-like proline 4-hydroxylase
LLAAASKGIGFFYGGYLMAHKLDDTGNEKMQFLHSVFEYLNGEEMLSLIREITGNDELKSADAQYTRFTPGQFLTRHRDENTNEQRRFAYVLAFSQNWHPDWGGLLQFFEDDGTPRDAWAPQFNSMSLFDVRHVHSVTFLAPFALEPRLSLTGWFRAK